MEQIAFFVNQRCAKERHHIVKALSKANMIQLSKSAA